ncbi:aldo/keto reductase [Clostridium sporogenes]|uniref:Aldo/keto reductase n=1 Tax=Clostridium botulinum TaxID=1491 RepID=A0A6M0SYH2_CLOBO|nr:aldo/keto reductase [Clostridium sporogenes]NFA59750.1 aldo/keto reductase [Clostridium botulinum]NFI72102.1 aldo/keto reductase [Clostridium sporogenes]NFL73429.1 aldo/keto reductase [Clostridium sporogenes]NFM23641.1 aldo/keto reductase [Clostridium sporogenes]NFP61050.1 aldo/keto reductase [Clostridium sporogenes]
MQDIKSYTVLSNGVKMPWLGFGTYKVEDGNTVISSVKEALKIGYSHIDTASYYGNEEGVGTAIKESGVPREDIFLVSKVWNSDQGYDKTLKSFEASIKKLGIDYLDLFLIHWPQPLSKETWKALEKLYKEGRVKAIGVSNFLVDHLKWLLEDAEIKPMVNQVEFHPRLIQKDLIEFCRKNSIQLEAWSPLMRGKVFQIELLQDLAKKYDKTISQIVLRWDLQMGVVTIPKSVTPSRIKENADIFDFEISKEDMDRIQQLDKGLRAGSNPNKVFPCSNIPK